MGDVATETLFALLGDEGEDPLANISQPKQEAKEKKQPARAAPAAGRPGRTTQMLHLPYGKISGCSTSVLTRCWSGGEIGW